MRIANGLYKAVKINWSNVTLPLKEGTPISKAGAVANTSSALGIVPQTVTQIPLVPEMYILVGGDVELAEVNASYGSSLTAAAKAAMSAIRFWTENGPDDSSDADSTPGPATADEPGIMKQAENIPELTSDSNTIALLREDINTLLAALKDAGIMEADPEPEPDPEEDGEEES